MAAQPTNTPVLLALGVACLLGSAVLAWLSAPVTLSLTRDSENRVTAAIEARLFGLFATDVQGIERIRSVTLQRASAPGRSSRTPDRLVFETAAGPVDLGRTQQLFAADHADIARFMEADGPAAFTRSSIADGAERRRFVVAQVAALFLGLIGLGVMGRAIAGLFG